MCRPLPSSLRTVGYCPNETLSSMRILGSSDDLRVCVYLSMFIYKGMHICIYVVCTLIFVQGLMKKIVPMLPTKLFNISVSLFVKLAV